MKLTLIQLLCLNTVICVEINTCFKKMYFRGIGKIGSVCEQKLEKNGLLCYSKCKDGYEGAGPMCWQTCDTGFTDYGSICWKNSQIYGKGCCCTIFTKDCCGNCPSGFNDDGCTCRRDFEVYHKKVYGRGVGKLMVCEKEFETDTGLCYEQCKDDYFGFGPFCFLKCDRRFSTDCGSFCGRNSTTCGKHVLGMMTSVASSNFCDNDTEDILCRHNSGFFSIDFDLGQIFENGLSWFTQKIFQYC